MGKKLLILGAGAYSLVAKEIAESTGSFEEIAFLDDGALHAPDGSCVLGKMTELKNIATNFTHAIVAIGNPSLRMELISRIQNDTACKVATLISPRAYVAPSATVAPGCIVEPFAVVHSKCVLETGCLVSAGAVVNHFSHLGQAVHIDCNATVSGYQTVPSDTKVEAGTVFAN